MPESDKVMDVQGFIPIQEIDKLYFDRPYHLAPIDEHDAEALALIMRSMQENKVVALAEAVLFRRNRTLLIRPQGDHVIATMLNFDYEVRPAADVFKDIPEMKFDKEMLELAGHIIGTKKGSFNPAEYEDRYEAALTELVKAKVEGRAPPKRTPKAEEKVVSLMDALRQSAGMKAKGPASKTAASTDSRRKKAS